MVKSKKQYHEWIRVHGPDLDAGKVDREKENKNIMESDSFQELCGKVGIEPTRRQASKYKRKRGLAYMYGRM